MSDAIVYNATGTVTERLLETVFKDAPVHEIESNGKKGRTLSGINGILLTGGFKLGKTTDIIKMFELKCMYQEPYKGKRQIHVGVLRNSNADFVDTLGKSFSYWYEEQSNKKFQYGFSIANQNTRPEITVRFPSIRYHRTENGVTAIQEKDDSGNLVDCEIVYFCYASNKKDDEKKMKGGEFTDTWSNEGNITSRESHEMISGRNNRYPPTGATRPLWIMDVNPTHKKSWEYVDYIANPKPDIRHIAYPSPLVFEKDPEGDHVLRGHVGTYKTNKEATIHGDYSYFYNNLSKSETFIINNILGEYTNIVEGVVVHDTFNPMRVVAEYGVPSNQTLIVCVDFGVKCGYIILAQDDDMNVHAVADGWSDRGFRKLYTEKIKKELDDNFPDHVESKNIIFVGDPRTGQKRDLINASTSVSLIDADGYDYRVPRRDDGAIIDNIDFRIDTVDQYIKEGMLTVSVKCELSIDAFSFGYVRNDLTGRPNKVKSGMYAEVMDSLQYGLTFIELGGDIEPSSNFVIYNKAYHAY